MGNGDENKKNRESYGSPKSPDSLKYTLLKDSSNKNQGLVRDALQGQPNQSAICSGERVAIKGPGEPEPPQNPEHVVHGVGSNEPMDSDLSMIIHHLNDDICALSERVTTKKSSIRKERHEVDLETTWETRKSKRKVAFPASPEWAAMNDDSFASMVEVDKMVDEALDVMAMRIIERASKGALQKNAALYEAQDQIAFLRRSLEEAHPPKEEEHANASRAQAEVKELCLRAQADAKSTQAEVLKAHAEAKDAHFQKEAARAEVSAMKVRDKRSQIANSCTVIQNTTTISMSCFLTNNDVPMVKNLPKLGELGTDTFTGVSLVRGEPIWLVEPAYALEWPLSVTFASETTRFHVRESDDGASSVQDDGIPLFHFLHRDLASSEDLPTLGKRMAKTRGLVWSPSGLRMQGEHQFLKGYTPWTLEVLLVYEDVLKLSSLLTAVQSSAGYFDRCANTMRALLEIWSHASNTWLFGHGEGGISLLDLHFIGGLPLVGAMYDEFVPHNSVIFGGVPLGGEASPPGLREVFEIYQLLSSQTIDGQVSFSRWVRFFYGEHPDAIENCVLGGKKEQAKVFPAIYVRRSAKDCVYLAAYLALFMCKFALPGSSDLIRPGCFFVACDMARGRQYALAQPVLCSIYYGLGAISRGKPFKGGDGPGLEGGEAFPGNFKTPFPAHYVFGWLSAYFPSTYATNTALAGSMCPQLVKIVGQKATFHTPGHARSLFGGDSFFTRRNPFPVGGCTDCSHELDGASIGISELMFVLSVRGGILPFRTLFGSKLEAYYPHRFARQHGLDQGCPFPVLFKKRYGKEGSKRKKDDLGTCRESWKAVHVRTAWATCLEFTEVNKFVVPHYGRVGWATEAYWRWWRITNTWYWQVDHSWKGENNSWRHDTKQGKNFVPPAFGKVFELEYPKDWEQLGVPQAIVVDEESPQVLALKESTRTLFDNLCSIFEWRQGRKVPDREGHPIQDLNTLIGSGPHGALDAGFRYGQASERVVPSQKGKKRRKLPVTSDVSESESVHEPLLRRKSARLTRSSPGSRPVASSPGPVLSEVEGTVAATVGAPDPTSVPSMLEVIPLVEQPVREPAPVALASSRWVSFDLAPCPSGSNPPPVMEMTRTTSGIAKEGVEIVPKRDPVVDVTPEQPVVTAPFDTNGGAEALLFMSSDVESCSETEGSLNEGFAEALPETSTSLAIVAPAEVTSVPSAPIVRPIFSVKSTMVVGMLRSGLLLLKGRPLVELGPEIIKLRGCAFALSTLDGEKEVFSYFDNLLKELEESRIEALRKEVEVNELQGVQLASLEASLTQHCKDVDACVQRRATLAAQKSEFNKQGTTHLARLRDLKAKILRLTSEFNELEKETNCWRAENQVLTAELSGFDRSIESGTTSVARIAQEVTDLKERAQKAITRMEAARAKINKIIYCF
ncbi:uncharacterized protein LOC18442492 isoform X2 [Amborella trichopoda]|uniref:uncharacterized protein LOC18442492 isoform X2 n=1 Tax=Amborella trichopoda TaxID=13333 RepID=UPI0009BF0B4E|nr:uncharacterized protein LOC18442492 isoform X2 [Amborella trichopoda]|eukprot:XP_020528084.1 uncharacterized protein LOC18442492 isoform X2 [Amborella trichopoda]